MARRALQGGGQGLDGVSQQLCDFHYLREAAKPIYEADRHAKKELKKRVRGSGRPPKSGEGGGEGRERRGSGDRARLLRRGESPPRPTMGCRRGGCWAEVARSAELDRRQLGPSGDSGGRLARGLESAAAVAAALAARNGALSPALREASNSVKREKRNHKNEEG